MSSRSFLDLTDRLAEVRALAGLDPSRSADESQPKISNAVNRACILLLSAHLEGFLEDLVQDALDYIVSVASPVERLPLALRALHAEKHLREIEPIKDRNIRAPRIQKLFMDEAALWTVGSVVQAAMIKPAVVRAEMSNPGSAEIKSFLRYLDVDIEEFLKLNGEIHLLGRVNGLVLRRNQVAHGEVNATATPVDVDGYISVVADLCRHIEDAVAAAVRRLCQLSVPPW
jgi:RiboL-PSP-HEPN